MVVSAQVSPSDLKPAPALAMASRMLSRSRVERCQVSAQRYSIGPQAISTTLPPAN